MQARQTTRVADSRRPGLAAICANSMSVGLLIVSTSGSTATFTPAAALAAGTLYTAVWGASAAFIGEAAGFNEGPEVAMDKRGKATVVWAKDEARKTNIVASRFE